MLDKNIKDQLTTIFGNLKSDIVLRVMDNGHSAEGKEMRDFIDDVASTSSCLSVEETVGDVAAPTFEIIKEGVPTGVKFCGIPNGHEFTSFGHTQCRRSGKESSR